MTAQVATATLEVFIADLAAKMGPTSGLKPTVVRSDGGGCSLAMERGIARDGRAASCGGGRPRDARTSPFT